MELLDLPATPQRLRRLAAAGALDAAGLERALQQIGQRPTAASWYAFARWHLLGLGALLLVAGVIFFVAANWSRLTPDIRLGLVAATLVAAAVAAGVLGLASLSGRVATLLAGLLFGPLMALYGQTYQTGADAWELFALWTLVLTAFAALARLEVGWVAWLVLAHVAVLTFQVQYVSGSNLFSASGLPALALLAAFDAGVIFLLERRAPRQALVVAAAALSGTGLVVITAATAIVDARFGGGLARLLAVALAAGAVTVLAAVYRRLIPDLFLLFLAASGGCILLSFGLGELMDVLDFDDGTVFLLLGLAICAQVWWLGRWLLAWRQHPAHAGGEG